MYKNLTPTFGFLAIVGFIIGAFLGLAIVELWWQSQLIGLRNDGGPIRGGGYYLTALYCSLSMGTIGVALIGMRWFPDETSAEKSDER